MRNRKTTISIFGANAAAVQNKRRRNVINFLLLLHRYD